LPQVAGDPEGSRDGLDRFEGKVGHAPCARLLVSSFS
jgi:hypothetical protein